jgi:hypothetical protein
MEPYNLLFWRIDSFLLTAEGACSSSCFPLDLAESSSEPDAPGEMLEQEKVYRLALSNASTEENRGNDLELRRLISKLFGSRVNAKMPSVATVKVDLATSAADLDPKKFLIGAETDENLPRDPEELTARPIKTKNCSASPETRKKILL